MKSDNPIIKRLEVLTECSFLAAIGSIPFSKALLETLLVISFVGWILVKVLKREPLSENKALLWSLLLLTVFSCVSIYDSGLLKVALRGVVKLLKYILVLLIAADLLKEPKYFKKLLIAGLIVFCVVGLDAVYQQIYKFDFIRHFRARETNTQIRLSGPFNQYGLLAAYLIALLPALTASLFAPFKNRAFAKRLGLFILTAFGFYLLYRTQSRGAWLACFVSLILLAIILRNKWLSILFAATVIVIPFIIPRNTIVHLDAQGKEQSIVERVQLWNRAVQVIKARPLFGCGINTYTQNHEKFDTIKNWRVPGYYAHNGYLQLAAETGLISLAIFVWILGFSIYSGYTGFRKSKNVLAAGFLAGYIALLLQVFCDTTLHNLQSAALIWFYTGLMFAFRKQANGSEIRI